LNSLTINNDKFIEYITEEEIQKKIKELAEKVNEDFEGKSPIFIGILNGAFMFLSDFIREIKIDCEVDFFKLSSYGDEKISSGNVKLLKDLNCQVKNRHIIIVEDIIDSGLSIKFIKKLIEAQEPASLRVVTLLFKPKNAKIDFEVDYVGFVIPNKFVIGYGLDCAQRYRNLRSIYVIE
jgi:hypoxanthine phosphoribosyltransferase